MTCKSIRHANVNVTEEIVTGRHYLAVPEVLAESLVDQLVPWLQTDPDLQALQYFPAVQFVQQDQTVQLLREDPEHPATPARLSDLGLLRGRPDPEGLAVP